MNQSPVPTIEEKISALRSGPIAALTAYDYPTSRILDENGADLILVGDTLGMMFAGLEDTTGVTMEQMLYHVSVVRRGVKRALLVGDMPYRSFDNPELAVANARRLIDAGADAIKLEGGLPVEAQVRAVREAGIPLIGHIGMLPQQVKEEKGYKKKGKTAEDAERLMADARFLDSAGAAAMVVESVVPEVAARITREIETPTIGIGAGSDCDGEVAVIHDVIGMYPWFVPPFVRPQADFARQLEQVVRDYVSRVHR